MLPVLRALSESLGRAGVRYCHWKSNWRLPEALRGETDLDLLVHRADRSRFLSLVGALGLKPASGEDHPSVWHCYGCDDESGRLFDLHVYYRLITGELIVKPLRILTRFWPRAGAAACGRAGGVEIRQSFRIPTVNTAPNLQIDSAIPSDFVRGMNSATAA